MNAATVIAKIIFDKGIRLLSGEAGALRKVDDQQLKNQIVTAYREACGGDIEVTVNLSSLRDHCHNAMQMLYAAAFEQIELGRVSDDIDYELFSMQHEERRDQRDEVVIHNARCRAEAA